ncbi:phage capsid protein [Burkholderia pseudomallei]|nr:phage capsid protein [Burkholderia pseudomallei]
MVLTAADVAYDDLTAFGRITIDHTGRCVEITVDGFEFSTNGSCRVHNAKAIAWARDVLDAHLRAMRLLPGADLISISDMTQEDLEQERERAAGR